MIRFAKSAEEPDAGNLLGRICGGLGRESTGLTRNRTFVQLALGLVSKPLSYSSLVIDGINSRYHFRQPLFLEVSMFSRNLISSIIMISSCAYAETIDVNQMLSSGNIHECQRQLTKAVKATPSSEYIASLALTNFLSSVETLSQNFYRYGLYPTFARQFQIPFLRLPIPVNKNPEVATPRAIRATIEGFRNDMAAIDALLDKFQAKDEIKVKLNLSKVRIDFDGDGNYSDGELFNNIYKFYNVQSQGNTELAVNFDTTDILWLHGYSNLLIALSDFILAHQWGNFFDYSAHLFFQNVNTSYTKNFDANPFDFNKYADIIGALHMLNVKVAHPEKIMSTKIHLQKMITLSRLMMKTLESETDNDFEWLPNSKQTSAIGVSLNAQMIADWQLFLDEADNILVGKKLIPHWRIKNGMGINMSKYFFNPNNFDIVLWAHGANTLPYLECGALSSQETWRRLQRTFQGNFVGFAFLIN